MNVKKFLLPACSLLLAAGLLAGCTTATGGSSTPINSNSSATAQGSTNATNTSAGNVTDKDLDASWDAATATTITLNGATATVEGSGAAADGSTVTISAAGTYVVSGTLADGRIVINAPTEADVRLVLNGVDITCTTTSPIECQQADKLIVILADGTENTLTDTANYVFPDSSTDEPNATLFSQEDLTLNGTGALTINANYNNGIGTKDDLVIVSGTLTVTAPGHAIRGRDSVTVLDGTLNLTAAGDGIQSNNNSGEADKGWIDLLGGNYTITAGHDGIQAETDLTLSGGSYTITAGGGSSSENVAEHAEKGFGGGFGGQRPDNADGTMPDISGFNPEDFDGTFPEGMTPPEGWDGSMPEGMAPPEGFDGTMPGGNRPDAQAGASSDSQSSGTDTIAADNVADTTATTLSAGGTDSSAADDTTTEDSDDTATSTSFKGVKAGGNLAITGGTLAIDSADDSVHSNGNVTVSGGTLTLATGDDGIHADADVAISGSPVIDITQSYEGIEGATVTLSGGTITVVASDDGVNAAGGSDGDTTGGFGGDRFTANDNYWVTIEGGTLNITAGADGIDSNGALNLSGGDITINMTNLNAVGGDGMFDSDGATTVNGATITGAGGNGFATMGSAPTAHQPTLQLSYSSTQSAGTTVELKDASGTTQLSFTPTQAFSCLVLTAPSLADGETYTVYTGGEKTVDVAISGVTGITDTGASATVGMQGGPGGGFGGRGQ